MYNELKETKELAADRLAEIRIMKRERDEERERKIELIVENKRLKV